MMIAFHRISTEPGSGTLGVASDSREDPRSRLDNMTCLGRLPCLTLDEDLLRYAREQYQIDGSQVSTLHWNKEDVPRCFARSVLRSLFLRMGREGRDHMAEVLGFEPLRRSTYRPPGREAVP